VSNASATPLPSSSAQFAQTSPPLPPGSLQVDGHASPSAVLPSSQSSPAVTMPLPQAVGVQFASQPSPLVVLPSSHASPGSTVPSPQPPALTTVSVQLRSVPVVPAVPSRAVSVHVPFGSSPMNALSAPSPGVVASAVPLAGSVRSPIGVPAASSKIVPA